MRCRREPVPSEVDGAAAVGAKVLKGALQQIEDQFESETNNDEPAHCG